MIVRSYNNLDEEIVKQIKEVEETCKLYDKTKGSITLDTSLNIHPTMKSVFLLYEEERLASVLLVFMPTVEVVAAISQKVFGDTYENAKSLIINSLNGNDRIQYVAKLDGVIIGMGAVSFDHNESLIYGLGILPEHQGNGYGREMLTLIILELTDKGVSKITLEVESRNDNAFHLYQKCGFVVETAFNYYKGNFHR